MHPEPTYDATQSPLRTPCPLHPGNGSIATCDRCGTFMCAQCVGPEGANVCPTCAEQAFSFPLIREDWRVSSLISLCWEAYKPQWLMMSVAFIVFMLAYYGVSMVTGLLAGLIGAVVGEASSVAAMIIAVALVGVSALVSAVLTLGFNRVCLDVLQGKQVSLGALFGEVGSLHLMVKLWGLLALVYGAAGGAIIGASALMGETAVLIGVLFLFPFALVASVATMLVMAGFVVHPELKFIAHVKRAVTMLGDGEIFAALGVALMMVLVIFAGALLCGIGLIPAYGLAMMFSVGLYLVLENDPKFALSASQGGLDSIR